MSKLARSASFEYLYVYMDLYSHYNFFFNFSEGMVYIDADFDV